MNKLNFILILLTSNIAFANAERVFMTINGKPMVVESEIRKELEPFRLNKELPKNCIKSKWSDKIIHLSENHYLQVGDEKWTSGKIIINPMSNDVHFCRNYIFEKIRRLRAQEVAQQLNLKPAKVDEWLFNNAKEELGLTSASPKYKIKKTYEPSMSLLLLAKYLYNSIYKKAPEIFQERLADPEFKQILADNYNTLMQALKNKGIEETDMPNKEDIIYVISMPGGIQSLPDDTLAALIEEDMKDSGIHVDYKAIKTFAYEYCNEEMPKPNRLSLSFDWIDGYPCYGYFTEE